MQTYEEMITEGRRKAEAEWQAVCDLRKVVASKLAVLGVGRVCWTYSGSGDWGSVEDATFDNEVAAAVADSFKDDLERIAYAVAHQAGHDWVNNDGGQGEIEWILATDKIHVDHEQNITSTEDSEYDY